MDDGAIDRAGPAAELAGGGGHTYAIPDVRFGEFRDEMVRLARRAVKLGFPEIGFTELRQFSRTDEQGRVMVFHEVEVRGERPILGGWEFRGRLEHMEGGVLVHARGDDAVPDEYKHADPCCEHCRTQRARASTYLLYSPEQDAFQQVGRSCLKDFFGNRDPKAVAAYAELLFGLADELRDWDDGSEQDFARSPCIPVMDVLRLAAAAIREAGGQYYSAERAEAAMVESTGSLVRHNLLDGRHVSEASRIRPVPEDDATAEATLAWLQSDEMGARAQEGLYFHNLRLMATLGAVSRRNIPLMVSAVQAHRRMLAQRAEDASAATSAHLGQVGERLATVVTMTAAIGIPGGAWGDKTLFKFVDEQGNRLAWFASGVTEMRPGDRALVVGTVKAHDEYRGVKQTVLARVSQPDLRLFEAVRAGDVAKLKKLLKTAWDVDVRNQDRETPLIALAKAGAQASSLEMATLLVDAGANPNAHDAWYRTPLVMATQAGDLPMIRHLRDLGARVDPYDGAAPKGVILPTDCIDEGDTETWEALGLDAPAPRGRMKG